MGEVEKPGEVSPEPEVNLDVEHQGANSVLGIDITELDKV